MSKEVVPAVLLAPIHTLNMRRGLVYMNDCVLSNSIKAENKNLYRKIIIAT